MSHMSTCTIACISGHNIKDLLTSKGLIEPKTLHGYKGREVHFDSVLDYSKCDAKEWDEHLKELLERGVIDCSKKNESGHYGVRRDYTPEEVSELHLYPIRIDEDGCHIMWASRYVHNGNPLFYLSRAFPDEVFTYDIDCEGDYDGGGYYQNGKEIADKPTAPLIGANGNIFNLAGITLATLRANNLAQYAANLSERITACPSYDAALRVLGDYVIFGDA